MLKEILTEEMIQIEEQVDTWEEAIRKAAEPLVSHAYINKQYVEAMIDNVKKMGPYIVISPDVAIAHARPDDNVSKIGLSFLKLNRSINFVDNNHAASLIFVLAAVDNDKHLSLLAQLAQVLNDNKRVECIKSSTFKETIHKIINENIGE